MKLTLGFSTTKSFISKAIRWFTNSEVSHTYIRFYDEFLETELVMHADWPGVIIEEAALFRLQNVVINEFEIDDPRMKASLKRNLRMLRKKYAWWNIAKWAWLITFRRWVKKKIIAPTEDPKEIICVDFALHITNNCGVTDLPYDYYVPDTLMKWVIENHESLKWKWSFDWKRSAAA